MDQPDQEPQRATPDRPDPIALVWPSRTKGMPHVVGIVDDPRFPTLTCTCRAYLGVKAGMHRGCWAMQATRELLGIEEEDDSGQASRTDG